MLTNVHAGVWGEWRPLSDSLGDKSEKDTFPSKQEFVWQTQSIKMAQNEDQKEIT